MATNPLPNFSIYWAGFKSNLHELHRAGWTINIDENHYNKTYNLAINNHLLKIVGLCGNITDEFLQNYKRNPDRCRGLRFEGTDWYPTLQMQYLSFKVAINIVGTGDINYRFARVDGLDIMPSHTMNLEDMLPKEKEHITEAGIIVPEYTIPELMGLIKEKQAPRQKEIRERLRKSTNPNIIQEEFKIIGISQEQLNAPIAQPGIRATPS